MGLTTRILLTDLSKAFDCIFFSSLFPSFIGGKQQYTFYAAHKVVWLAHKEESASWWANASFPPESQSGRRTCFHFFYIFNFLYVLFFNIHLWYF